MSHFRNNPTKFETDLAGFQILLPVIEHRTQSESTILTR